MKNAAARGSAASPWMLPLAGVATIFAVAALVALALGRARPPEIAVPPVKNWPRGFPVAAGADETTASFLGRHGDLASYIVSVRMTEPPDVAERTYAALLRKNGWRVFNETGSENLAHLSFVGVDDIAGERNRGEMFIAVRDGASAVTATIGIIER